jgi:pimeloyl-ACP methyl ester carboxylesterase
VIEKAFAPNPVTPRFRAEFPIGMALRPWQLRAAAEEIAMMQTAPARLSARYRELACPVTLLSGRADQIVDPRRHTERLAAQLPHARIAVIENVGHMLPHIVPTEVMRAATDRAAAEPSMHAI